MNLLATSGCQTLLIQSNFKKFEADQYSFKGDLGG